MKDSRCAEFNMRLSHPSAADSLLAEHESGGGLTSYFQAASRARCAKLSRRASGHYQGAFCC